MATAADDSCASSQAGDIFRCSARGGKSFSLPLLCNECCRNDPVVMSLLGDVMGGMMGGGGGAGGNPMAAMMAQMGGAAAAGGAPPDVEDMGEIN
eukprot:COSAG02_NODE_5329_length_4432_cov_6.439188_4_plen_95_part_00